MFRCTVAVLATTRCIRIDRFAKFCHENRVQNGLKSGPTPVDTVVSAHSNEWPGVFAVRFL
jgi:hypothetical protein